MEAQNFANKMPDYYENETYLKWLKENLKRADNFIWDDKCDEAIEEYMQLAKDFISRIKDYHVSAYLYKKCMDLAKLNKVRKPG